MPFAQPVRKPAQENGRGPKSLPAGLALATFESNQSPLFEAAARYPHTCHVGPTIGGLTLNACIGIADGMAPCDGLIVVPAGYWAIAALGVVTNATLLYEELPPALNARTRYEYVLRRLTAVSEKTEVFEPV